MDPFITGALIQAGAGLLGGALSKEDREKGYNIPQELLNEISGIQAPDKEALKLYLQNFSSAGTYDPRLEAAIALGPSQMAGVAADPRLAATQMQNLETLQSIVEAGGYDPSIKADLASALRQQEQAVKSKQAQVEMEAAAKGMTSSGATRALKEMASQSEANRMSELQNRLAATAYQNRLNALSGASGEAGRMRSQDVQEQEARARAADEIARFNAGLASSRETRNVSSMNEAQLKNLANAQDIQNKNIELRHAEEKSRAGAEQTDYQNLLDKIRIKSGAAGTASQAATAKGDATAGMIAGIGEAAAGAYVGSQLYGDKNKEMDKEQKDLFDTMMSGGSKSSTTNQYGSGRGSLS